MHYLSTTMAAMALLALVIAAPTPELSLTAQLQLADM